MKTFIFHFFAIYNYFQNIWISLHLVVKLIFKISGERFRNYDLWVPLITPYVFGNFQNCLKSFIIAHVYAPTSQDMSTFIVGTNSCSTNNIMDFPIAKSLLQIKKLPAWANFYIINDTWISIGDSISIPSVFLKGIRSYQQWVQAHWLEKEKNR